MGDAAGRNVVDLPRDRDDLDPDADAMDAEYAFTRDVELEARRIRVRDAARVKVAAERHGQEDPPPVVTLTDFLAVEDPAVAYRVDGLWPAGGRVVLAAQWKAGKTTAVANLLRSLVDGEPFLGRFGVHRAGSVVLIDNELDADTLRRWLRAHAVRNTDAVRLVSLRGRVSAFDLLDPDVLAQWVDRLAGADVVVFDCLRPVLDALGLDESKEAGRFLVPFDAFLRGVRSGRDGPAAADGLVVHHMGHHGERSRGDSRILDWPDATWKLVRNDPDDPASPRYLSAYGRDVDVAEGLLTYDDTTRRLALAGGNRRDTAADQHVPTVLEVLASSAEGLSGRKLEEALVETGMGRNEARSAVRRAVKTGRVDTVPGPRNSTLHVLSAPVRHSSPVDPAHSSSECASAPIGAHGAHSPHPEQLSAPPGAVDRLPLAPCPGCHRQTATRNLDEHGGVCGTCARTGKAPS